MYYSSFEFQKRNISYQGLKHKMNDAECHELQEVFYLLHINSIEKS